MKTSGKYIVLLLMFLFASCDFLQTRDAEEPNTSRDDFLPSTSPEILFQNLTNAFKNKVTENYISCFVDPAYTNKTFNFVPTASASVIYPVFQNWDLNSERDYFNSLVNILPKETPIILSLTQLGYTQYGDSAVYDFSYLINLNFENENLSPTYQGNLKFTIVLDSRQQWVISKWIDFEQDGLPSWSELKGRSY
jgi:hypothetical protein